VDHKIGNADRSMTVVTAYHSSATHATRSATGLLSHHPLIPSSCHTHCIEIILHSCITSPHPDAKVQTSSCLTA